MSVFAISGTLTQAAMDAYAPNASESFHDWMWKFRRAVPIKFWPKTPEQDVFLRSCYSDGHDSIRAAVEYLKFFQLV
jgi:hypothetical protein